MPSRTTKYRNRLRERDPEKYKQYLETQKQKAKARRDQLKKELSKKNPMEWAVEMKKKMNEGHKKRQRNYIERKKLTANTIGSTSKKTEGNKVSCKILHKETRHSVVMKRQYWREAKKKQRDNMSYQKKMWIRKKDREKKRELRNRNKPVSNGKENSTDKTPFATKKTEYNRTAKARSALPKTPEKFAKVVVNLIQNSSQRKKTALERLDAGNSKRRRLFCDQKINLKQLHSSTEGKTALKIIASKLKKMASQRLLAKEFGLTRKTILKYCVKRKPRKDKINVNHVSKFYFRSDVSKVMPAKRFATKRGPGYLLQMPLSSVFKIFKMEHKNCCHIQFSKFASLRPKNVKLLNNSHREYCVCVYCYNVRYKVLALDTLCEEKISDEIKFLSIITCPKSDGERFYQKPCVDGKCDSCGNVKKLITKHYAHLNKNEVVTWNHWEYQSVHGKARRVLVSKEGTVSDLIEELINDCNYGPTYKKHIFTAHWQQYQFNKIKNNLPDNSILQVIDFAKNRTVRYQDEIKSAYFAAQQVTLHPVITYYKNDVGETVRDALMFFSNDRLHDFHAVNHFMKQADKELLRELGKDKMKQKIVFSDGCSSQYKSKGPFADLSLEQARKINRNYFGSEHGKSEGDGEIGVVGRAIERAVLSRRVIINSAEDMFLFCQENLTVSEGSSQRHFYFVKSDEIDRYRPYTDVKTLNTSRSLHQVFNVIGKPYSLLKRDLSCFCPSCLNEGDFCSNMKFVEKLKEVTLKKLDVSPSIEKDNLSEMVPMVNDGDQGSFNFDEFIQNVELFDDGPISTSDGPISTSDGPISKEEEGSDFPSDAQKDLKRLLQLILGLPFILPNKQMDLYRWRENLVYFYLMLYQQYQTQHSLYTAHDCCIRLIFNFE